MTGERLIARYQKAIGNRRETPTIQQYCQTLLTFSRFVGKETGFTRQDFLNYFNKLIKDEMSGATISKYYYSLKSVFDTLEMDFGITEKDLPKGRSSKNQNQPILYVPETLRLIEWCKSEGAVDDRFYLMMSTVYGLRREEMTRLTPESFFNSFVNIDTAKHGKPRTHIVPSKLESIIIEAVSAGQIPQAASTLSVMFNNMNRKFGRKSIDGESWHSIRRGLITALVNTNQLARPVIRNYMRWAEVNSRDMLDRYYQPDEAEVDKSVFAVHPYLGAW